MSEENDMIKNDKKKLALIKKLRVLAQKSDYEIAHWKADELLIEYINDKEIEEAYDKVGKWYA